MIRRLPNARPALIATLAIVVLAGCSSAATPGWTYAPAASASAAASGAASGSPAASASASAAASVGPSVAPSAAASASAASGGVLTVKAPVGAATAGFDPTTLTTTANSAFTLKFENEDNQAPHNLILQNPDGSPVKVTGDTSFFTGPGEREYQVPGLTAGTYTYMCQVHPTTMKGTLTVQ